MWARTGLSLGRVLNLFYLLQHGCRAFLHINQSRALLKRTPITRMTTSIADLLHWIEIAWSPMVKRWGHWAWHKLGKWFAGTASMPIFHCLAFTPRRELLEKAGTLDVTIESSYLRMNPASDWVKMADDGILSLNKPATGTSPRQLMSSMFLQMRMIFKWCEAGN